MNRCSSGGNDLDAEKAPFMSRYLMFFLFCLLAYAGAQTASVEHSLEPLSGKKAPSIESKTTLVMSTELGDVTIEVYPEAAPHAAERFVELAESGFFDNTAVSRMVSGFVAQFGINWREPHRQWKEKTFDDDPTYFALKRGTVAFAKAGLNTNSTQVFINLRDNSYLASPEYNFTVFGRVVDGMEIVDQFAMVGDPQGGLDQGRLWRNGGEYLDSLGMKPTMILSVKKQEEKAGKDSESEDG